MLQLHLKIKKTLRFLVLIICFFEQLQASQKPEDQQIDQEKSKLYAYLSSFEQRDIDLPCGSKNIISLDFSDLPQGNFATNYHVDGVLVGRLFTTDNMIYFRAIGELSHDFLLVNPIKTNSFAVETPGKISFQQPTQVTTAFLTCKSVIFFDTFSSEKDLIVKASDSCTTHSSLDCLNFKFEGQLFHVTAKGVIEVGEIGNFSKLKSLYNQGRISFVQGAQVATNSLENYGTLHVGIFDITAKDFCNKGTVDITDSFFATCDSIDNQSRLKIRNDCFLRQVGRLSTHQNSQWHVGRDWKANIDRLFLEGYASVGNLALFTVGSHAKLGGPFRACILDLQSNELIACTPQAEFFIKHHLGLRARGWIGYEGDTLEKSFIENKQEPLSLVEDPLLAIYPQGVFLHSEQSGIKKSGTIVARDGSVSLVANKFVTHTGLTQAVSHDRAMLSVHAQSLDFDKKSLLKSGSAQLTAQNFIQQHGQGFMDRQLHIDAPKVTHTGLLEVGEQSIMNADALLLTKDSVLKSGSAQLTAQNSIDQHGKVLIDKQLHIAAPKVMHTGLSDVDDHMAINSHELAAEATSQMQAKTIAIKAQQSITQKGNIDATEQLSARTNSLENSGTIHAYNAKLKIDRWLWNHGIITTDDILAIDALASMNSFGYMQAKNLTQNVGLHSNFLGCYQAQNSNINSLIDSSFGGVYLPQINSWQDVFNAKNYMTIAETIGLMYVPAYFSMAYRGSKSLTSLPALGNRICELPGQINSLYNQQDAGPSDWIPVLCGAKDLCIAVKQVVKTNGEIIAKDEKGNITCEALQQNISKVAEQSQELLSKDQKFWEQKASEFEREAWQQVSDASKEYHPGQILQKTSDAMNTFDVFDPVTQKKSFLFANEGAKLAMAWGPQLNRSSILDVDAGINLGINGNSTSLWSMHVGVSAFANNYTIDTCEGKNFGPLVANNLNISATGDYSHSGSCASLYGVSGSAIGNDLDIHSKIRMIDRLSLQARKNVRCSTKIHVGNVGIKAEENVDLLTDSTIDADSGSATIAGKNVTSAAGIKTRENLTIKADELVNLLHNGNVNIQTGPINVVAKNITTAAPMQAQNNIILQAEEAIDLCGSSNIEVHNGLLYGAAKTIKNKGTIDVHAIPPTKISDAELQSQKDGCITVEKSPDKMGEVQFVATDSVINEGDITSQHIFARANFVENPGEINSQGMHIKGDGWFWNTGHVKIDGIASIDALACLNTMSSKNSAILCNKFDNACNKIIAEIDEPLSLGTSMMLNLVSGGDKFTKNCIWNTYKICKNYNHQEMVNEIHEILNTFSSIEAGTLNINAGININALGCYKARDMHVDSLLDLNVGLYMPKINSFDDLHYYATKPENVMMIAESAFIMVTPPLVGKTWKAGRAACNFAQQSGKIPLLCEQATKLYEQGDTGASSWIPIVCGAKNIAMSGVNLVRTGVEARTEALAVYEAIPILLPPSTSDLEIGNNKSAELDSQSPTLDSGIESIKTVETDNQPAALLDSTNKNESEKLSYSQQITSEFKKLSYLQQEAFKFKGKAAYIGNKLYNFDVTQQTSDLWTGYHPGMMQKTSDSNSEVSNKKTAESNNQSPILDPEIGNNNQAAEVDNQLPTLDPQVDNKPVVSPDTTNKNESKKPVSWMQKTSDAVTKFDISDPATQKQSFLCVNEAAKLAMACGPNMNRSSILDLDTGVNLGVNGNSTSIWSVHTGASCFANNYTIDTWHGINRGPIIANNLTISAMGDYSNVGPYADLYGISGSVSGEDLDIHGKLRMFDRLSLQARKNARLNADIGADHTRIESQTLNNQGAIKGGLRLKVAEEPINIGTVDAQGKQVEYLGPLQDGFVDQLVDGKGDQMNISNVSEIIIRGGTQNVHLKQQHNVDHTLNIQTIGSIGIDQKVSSKGAISLDAGQNINHKSLQAGTDIDMSAKNNIAAQSTSTRVGDDKNYQDVLEQVFVQAGNKIKVHADGNVYHEAIHTKSGVEGTHLTAGKNIIDNAHVLQGRIETHTTKKTSEDTTTEHSYEATSRHESTGNYTAHAGGKYIGVAPTFYTTGRAPIYEGKQGTEFRKAHASTKYISNTTKDGGWLGHSKDTHDPSISYHSRGVAFNTTEQPIISAPTGGVILEAPSGTAPAIKSPGGATISLGESSYELDMHTKGSNLIFNSEELRRRADHTYHPLTIKGKMDIDAPVVNIETVRGQNSDALVNMMSDGVINQTFVDNVHFRDYQSKTSLTPQASIVLALAVTMATAGIGSSAGAGLVAFTGAESVMAVGMIETMTAATISTLSVKIAQELAECQGDLGQAARNVASTDTLKQLALSVATAGLTEGLNQTFDKVGLPKVSKADSFLQRVKYAAPREFALSAMLLGVAAISGQDIKAASKQYLRQATAGTVGTVFASEIGSQYEKGKIGFVAHKALHTMNGAITGGIVGGKRGAIAGATGALIAETLADTFAPQKLDPAITQDLETHYGRKLISDEFNFHWSNKRQEYMESVSRVAKAAKIVPAIAALAAGQDVSTASFAANTAIDNNFLVLAVYGLIAADVAYSAYCIYDAYETGGRDAALKQLGIEVVCHGAGYIGGQAIYKVGSIVYPTAKAAIHAVVRKTPGLKSAMGSFFDEIIVVGETFGKSTLGKGITCVETSILKLETKACNSALGKGIAQTKAAVARTKAKVWNKAVQGWNKVAKNKHAASGHIKRLRRTPAVKLPASKPNVPASVPTQEATEILAEKALPVSQKVMQSELAMSEQSLPASSRINKIKLHNQLIAEEIGGGHAFEKHVLNQGEFPGYIRTRKQFKQHIEKVRRNPTLYKNNACKKDTISACKKHNIIYCEKEPSKHIYYQEQSSTMVINNQHAPDGGTAYQAGIEEFHKQN